MKRGRPNMRWIDSIKEATGRSRQKLNRVVEDRALWTSFLGSPRVKADTLAWNLGKSYFNLIRLWDGKRLFQCKYSLTWHLRLSTLWTLLKSYFPLFPFSPEEFCFTCSLFSCYFPYLIWFPLLPISFFSSRSVWMFILLWISLVSSKSTVIIKSSLALC